MASLPTLPVEILSLIANHLVHPSLGFSDAGILNLRLTCRALCLKTQYSLGKAAFSTLRLDLHPKTLQRWLTICKRPAFGHAVKRLVFAHWGDERVAFPHVEEAGLGNFNDQVLFVLWSIFSEAFGDMSNLREIVIIAPFVARFQRHAYLPMEFTTTCLSDGGIRREHMCVSVDMLWALSMRAAVESGIHLSRLEVTNATPTREMRHLSSFSVSDRTLEATSAALESLEQLIIIIDASESSTTGNNSLTQTLNSMTDLRHLSLKAVRSPLDLSINLFLPRLTNLNLTGVRLQEAELKCSLLSCKASLQHLRLVGLVLTSEGSWRSILILVLEEMAKLSSLHMRNLLEAKTGPWSGSQQWLRFDRNGRLEVLSGLVELLERG